MFNESNLLDVLKAAHILQCHDITLNDRRLINLKFLYHMSDREIAQRMGMTVEALRAEFVRLAALSSTPVQLEFAARSVPADARQRHPRSCLLRPLLTTIPVR